LTATLAEVQQELSAWLVEFPEELIVSFVEEQQLHPQL